MANELIYLYGFTPDDAAPPSNLVGLAGSPVSLIGLGAVQAVISRVQADEYEPGRIEARLQDLQWVSEQGVAHESVVAWFVDHAEILPASLFTLYSGETALRDAVEARIGELEAQLARLANKREWDLKISYSEKRVADHAGELSPRVAEFDRELAAATPGKRYLLEKKRAELVSAETRAAALQLAQQTFATVKQAAADTRSLPLPRTREALPVILHAAALVERERETELLQVMEKEGRRLEALGITLQFSGPWAPYRFMGDDERAAGTT